MTHTTRTSNKTPESIIDSIRASINTKSCSWIQIVALDDGEFRIDCDHDDDRDLYFVLQRRLEFKPKDLESLGMRVVRLFRARRVSQAFSIVTRRRAEETADLVCVELEKLIDNDKMRSIGPAQRVHHRNGNGHLGDRNRLSVIYVAGSIMTPEFPPARYEDADDRYKLAESSLPRAHADEWRQIQERVIELLSPAVTVPPQRFHEALSEVSAALGAMHESVRVVLQRYIDHLAKELHGRPIGKKATCDEWVELLRRALDDSSLKLACPDCGTPSRPNTQTTVSSLRFAHPGPPGGYHAFTKARGRPTRAQAWIEPLEVVKPPPDDPTKPRSRRK